MTLVMNRRLLLASVASSVLTVRMALAAKTADIIYSGGPILTMDDANPRPEAVAVRSGRIIAAGSAVEVMKLKVATTKLVDLGGRAMLPGFVDSHGHVMMGGLQALSANMLPPPDGPNSDIATIQQTLRDWAAANKDIVRAANLIIGFGYDNSQLKELRHPTRDDLDAVSSDVPIFIVHQSGHIAALNSKALAAAGYTADSADPEGGVIQRKPGSKEPNGVLEELAFFGAIPAIFKNVGRWA